MAENAKLSTDTLLFFRELLGQVSLPASAPNFEEQATRLIRVRKELDAAIAATLPDAANERE